MCLTVYGSCVCACVSSGMCVCRIGTEESREAVIVIKVHWVVHACENEK